MTEYFLIGNPLGHSFSADFFNRKFEREGINARYSLCELKSIDGLPEHLASLGEGWRGFNVTAPYKQSVIKFLSRLTAEARSAAAVNCVRCEADGTLTGHNTDCAGFETLLKANAGTDLEGCSALVIGGGGVVGAILEVLRKNGVVPAIMTRTPARFIERYPDWNIKIMPLDRQNRKAILEADIIINATPLGTFPDINSAPDIAYEYIQPGHVCLDVVYNPEDTLFCRICSAHGAKTASGMPMLVAQAEEAWKFWNRLS